MIRYLTKQFELTFILPSHFAILVYLAIFTSTTLVGCATQPGVFQFNAPNVATSKDLTWPSKNQAEIPRYLYLGEITGESNFHRPEGKGFIRWVTDFITGESAPVTLQRPQAGVVDETGRIFVTDTSRQAVYVFDQQQGRMDIWEQAVGKVHFSSPTGIALGLDGEVFVADSNLGYVVKLNRRGENVGVIGKGLLKRPVGLAFDNLQNHLYVADTYAHNIKIFDVEGHLLHTLGQRGDGEGEFNFPTYIALNQGELYVVDTMAAQVDVMDTVSGKPKRKFGARGLKVGNLVRPKGVAVDSESNVYIVESYYDHLLIYNQQGQFLLPIGGTGREPGQFYLPTGVWVDQNNRVYVADMFNGRISVFQYLGGHPAGE